MVISFPSKQGSRNAVLFFFILPRIPPENNRSPPHREDTIHPPTLQIFEQNRYTPAKPLMLQMYHVST